MVDPPLERFEEFEPPPAAAPPLAVAACLRGAFVCFVVVVLEYDRPPVEVDGAVVVGELLAAPWLVPELEEPPQAAIDRKTGSRPRKVRRRLTFLS